MSIIEKVFSLIQLMMIIKYVGEVAVLCFSVCSLVSYSN